MGCWANSFLGRDGKGQNAIGSMGIMPTQALYAAQPPAFLNCHLPINLRRYRTIQRPFAKKTPAEAAPSAVADKGKSHRHQNLTASGKIAPKPF